MRHCMALRLTSEDAKGEKEELGHLGRCPSILGDGVDRSEGKGAGSAHKSELRQESGICAGAAHSTFWEVSVKAVG